MRKIGIIIIIAVLGFFGSAIFLGNEKTQMADKHMMMHNNAMPMHEHKEMMKDNNVNSGISKDDAVNIAIESSKVDMASIYNLNVKAKNYYGIDIYDVEFTSDSREYNYNIDQNTGEIVAMDYEIDKKYFSQLTGQPISEDDAKALIADKITGISAKSIPLISEHEDNYQQFEGKFIHEGIQYEFTIDKATGNIVEWKWKKHNN